MAKPKAYITPPSRHSIWKAKWGKATLLGEEETLAAYEEFINEFIVGHMTRRFEKTFGVPKATFGNRFFHEDAVFYPLDVRIGSILNQGGHIEATVIYGSPDTVEAHKMRSEVRRSFRDMFEDDWQAALGIVRAVDRTFYVFVEPKGRGCIAIVRKLEGVETSEADIDPDAP